MKVIKIIKILKKKQKKKNQEMEGGEVKKCLIYSRSWVQL